MRTHLPVLSDVFSAVQGFPAIALHVPVFRDNMFHGTLGVLLDFSIISMHFLQDIRLGETGYAWVTSADGIELYCPVPGHTGESVFENCKKFPTILTMAQDMVRGGQNETTYVFDQIRDQTIESIKKHAVYRPIRIVDSFWSIVVATSEDEALAVLSGFRDKLFMIGGLLLFIGLLFAYYGMKVWGIVREERKRREAEKELAAIFSMSLDMICIADIDTGTFLKVNPAFTETLEIIQPQLQDAIDCWLWTPIFKEAKDGKPSQENFRRITLTRGLPGREIEGSLAKASLFNYLFD